VANSRSSKTKFKFPSSLVGDLCNISASWGATSSETMPGILALAQLIESGAIIVAAMQNCWSLAVFFLEALTLVSCTSESSPIVEHTVGQAGALCGEDQLSTRQAYNALRRGDKKGAAGLMSRNQVDFLRSGIIVGGSTRRDDGLLK
jgi:hypothetical protein